MANQNFMQRLQQKRAAGAMGAGKPAAAPAKPQDTENYTANDMSGYHDQLAAMSPEALVGMIEEMGAGMPSEEFKALLDEAAQGDTAEGEDQGGAAAMMDRIAKAGTGATTAAGTDQTATAKA